MGGGEGEESGADLLCLPLADVDSRTNRAERGRVGRGGQGCDGSKVRGRLRLGFAVACDLRKCGLGHGEVTAQRRGVGSSRAFRLARLGFCLGFVGTVMSLSARDLYARSSALGRSQGGNFADPAR